jgi:hypothetical protein
MSMVVVKTRSVAQHQIAFDFVECERALGVLSEVIGFIDVLQQLLDAETSCVAMWVFATVIPTHAHPGSGGTADERDGFGNDIDPIRLLARDADLCFCSKLYIHHADLIRKTVKTVTGLTLNRSILLKSASGFAAEPLNRFNGVGLTA